MKKRKPIIGVMGPGKGAAPADEDSAYQLGELIAREGWILLSGGVALGVMYAVNKGAANAGGLTVGIIPRLDSEIADEVAIPIVTDMGSARNNINVLSSNVVIACGMGVGTASEIALALNDRARKPVILLNSTQSAVGFFKSFDTELIHVAKDAHDAIRITKQLLTEQNIL